MLCAVNLFGLLSAIDWRRGRSPRFVRFYCPIITAGILTGSFRILTDELPVIGEKLRAENFLLGVGKIGIRSLYVFFSEAKRFVFSAARDHKLFIARDNLIIGI